MQEKDLREIAEQTPPIERPDWLVSQDGSASPASLQSRDPSNIRWYLPSWDERIKLMGWRNIFWLPAILLLFGLIALATRPRLFAQSFIYWKLMVFAVAGPVALAMDQARKSLRLRKDPFCIHCGYSLVGLPSATHPCPECGEPTDPAQCIEYSRDPHWYIQRYKQRHAHPQTHAAFEAGAIRQENPDRL